jgi:hypothetical protein
MFLNESLVIVSQVRVSFRYLLACPVSQSGGREMPQHTLHPDGLGRVGKPYTNKRKLNISYSTKAKRASVFTEACSSHGMVSEHVPAARMPHLTDIEYVLLNSFMEEDMRFQDQIGQGITHRIDWVLEGLVSATREIRLWFSQEPA